MNVASYEVNYGYEFKQCRAQIDAAKIELCATYVDRIKDDVLSLYIGQAIPSPRDGTINYCQDELRASIKSQLDAMDEIKFFDKDLVELTKYRLTIPAISINSVSSVFLHKNRAYWMFIIKTEADEFKVRFSDLAKARYAHEKLLSLL